MNQVNTFECTGLMSHSEGQMVEIEVPDDILKCSLHGEKLVISIKIGQPEKQSCGELVIIKLVVMVALLRHLVAGNRISTFPLG